MFTLLSIICICITTIYVVNFIQSHTITFKIHKVYEEVQPPEKPLTEEEKKLLEEQQTITDGMNEVIKFTQEFLGGEVEDADAKRKAE